MFGLLDNHAQNQAVSLVHIVFYTIQRITIMFGQSVQSSVLTHEVLSSSRSDRMTEEFKTFHFFHQHRLSTAAVIVENLQVVSDCKHVKIGQYLGIFGGHSETTWSM